VDHHDEARGYRVPRRGSGRWGTGSALSTLQQGLEVLVAARAWIERIEAFWATQLDALGEYLDSLAEDDIAS
jgi:hypothetical protein